MSTIKPIKEPTNSYKDTVERTDISVEEPRLNNITPSEAITIFVHLRGEQFELHERCLKSLVKFNDPDLRLRIIANNVGEDSALEIKRLSANLKIEHVYVYNEEIPLYKLMRECLRKDKIESRVFGWMEDICRVSNASWLSAAKLAIQNAASNAGAWGVRVKHVINRNLMSAINWFEHAKWKNGRLIINGTDSYGQANSLVIYSLLNTFYLIRTDLIDKCNLPDERLVSGGSCVIGEQLRQNGYKIEPFNLGHIYINKLPIELLSREHIVKDTCPWDDPSYIHSKPTVPVKSFRLLNRSVVGEGVHHSGWPMAVKALRDLSSYNGPLLDDFVDYTFRNSNANEPHNSSWVGIFHYPVSIKGAVPGDYVSSLKFVVNSKYWKSSTHYLKGAIALCDDVANEVRNWLRIPTITLRFPMELNVTKWSDAEAFKSKLVVQAGYFLRNLQFIYQIETLDWQRIHLADNHIRYNIREKNIRNLNLRPDIRREDVTYVPRLSNKEYDELLSKSVIVNELYGAAANNLIVECIVRGTPIIVNRLPAIEEYLGSDYKLYYNSIEEIPALLDHKILLEASSQLLERSKIIPSFKEFAANTREFINDVCNSKSTT